MKKHYSKGNSPTQHQTAVKPWRKIKIFSFMLGFLFLCAPGILKAQPITIGTGTTVQRYPLGTYYGFERSAAIYTAAEIGALG